MGYHFDVIPAGNQPAGGDIPGDHKAYNEPKAMTHGIQGAALNGWIEFLPALPNWGQVPLRSQLAFAPNAP